MEQRDLDWLAGLLEGEGSFCMTGKDQNPVIAVRMTDEDVIARVASLLDCTYSKYDKHRSATWKAAYVIYFSGARAIKMMEKLKPLMGIRRQEQIKTVLAGCKRSTPRPYLWQTGGERTTIRRQRKAPSDV